MTTSPSDPAPQLALWRTHTEQQLARALDEEIGPAKLAAAMRHAALNGGKRIRPLLVYATGNALGQSLAALDDAAIAIELLHCYSLVHDDLPAMDDDALRRGQPTVHIAFDEATAILAGDALQTLAFARLGKAPLPAEVRLSMLTTLAEAAGGRGMCGGQMLDMQATGHLIDLAALETLHAMKTGALLRAAVRLGALAAAATPMQLAALDVYAAALGLAFQIKDDLLDVESSSDVLGKTVGKDVAAAKATFPALLGKEASNARLAALHADM